MESLQWITSPTDPTLRRAQRRISGWDCCAGCTPLCPHEPKLPGAPANNYGQHGDEWWFFVGGQHGGVNLVVFTDYDVANPAHQEKMARQRAAFSIGGEAFARGATLSLHVDFPTTREQVLEGPLLRACALAEPCYSGGTTYTGASELFAQHGDPTSFVQPEAFWLALESRFKEMYVQAEAERQHGRRCTRCDGSGVENP